LGIENAARMKKLIEALNRQGSASLRAARESLEAAATNRRAAVADAENEGLDAANRLPPQARAEPAPLLPPLAAKAKEDFFRLVLGTLRKVLDHEEAQAEDEEDEK